MDARLTHTRSGLYGAMFIAGACAAAVTVEGSDRVSQVIEAGLSVVPPASRFAEAIAFGSELGVSDLDNEAAIDRIHERYGQLHWVHSLNNSCLLAFALVRGAEDFGATVALAVVGGWDTDSVGASAGSIVGALLGAGGLPDAWVAPLRNRLATSIPGLDGIGFDELADRTLAVSVGAR
jgi:ADP-ribosylglycohydrolase